MPKMAIRFASFESESSVTSRRTELIRLAYKGWMTGPDGKVSNKGTFLAGLGAGATEAVAVVTPMEVIKIRLQAQQRASRGRC